MENLPNEIIHEILITNMNSCKDILNFCITNSKNKEMCKDDSIYLIKQAIRKKFPSFNVNAFVEKLNIEFDKKKTPSKKFSYLHGNGTYQKEFDSMSDIKINPERPYLWSDVKKNLLKLSKILKDNNINELKIIINSLPSISKFWIRFMEITINDPDNINKKINYILNPYKDFEEKYKKLQELNLDEIIDIFIRKNSDKWIDIGNYKQFNFNSKNYCFNIIPPVNFPEGTEKRKYILTILCRILNINNSQKKMEKRKIITDAINHIYNPNVSWQSIEKYTKIRKKKNLIDLDKYLYNIMSSSQYTNNKDEAIEYILNEMCNKISLDIM